MKRGAPLKRSRMKPGRRKPRPSLEAFHLAVCRAGWCHLEDGHCSAGPLEAHHYVGKAKLVGLPAAYVDPRNGVPLCAFHHAQVTNGRVECPEPPFLQAFLDDHKLLRSGRPDPLKREAA